MVIMHIDTLGLELDIASCIYKAIAQDYCARVSNASFTDDESEHILDDQIYGNSKETIDDIVNKVAQLLMIQTGAMTGEAEING